jgi:transcriptional antiterminator
MRGTQKQLVIEMIEALKECQNELSMNSNSELINKINELLDKAHNEFESVLSDETLNELITFVKEEDEPISDDDMDLLAGMLGHL